LIAEAQEVIAEKIEDKDFLALPAADQVAYWEDFKKKYRGVALPDAYREAVKKVQEEQRAAAQLAEEEKLAETEDVQEVRRMSSRKRRKLKRAGRYPSSGSTADPKEP